MKQCHMVSNLPCWMASYAVGHPKQRKVMLGWLKSLCFGAWRILLPSSMVDFVPWDSIMQRAHWSPLCPLTSNGSLSNLPTVWVMWLVNIKPHLMALEANVCRVWQPLIPSQCTRGSNNEDEWAAEVSFVICMEL